MAGFDLEEYLKKTTTQVTKKDVPFPQKTTRKCEKCNSWKKKGICVNCHYREKQEREARMLEVDGRLPSPPKVGKI